MARIGKIVKQFVFLALFIFAMPAAWAQEQNPSFSIHNRSGVTIERLFASLSNTKGWGDDRLGSSILRRGHSFRVVLPPGDCLYDMQVLFDDGSSAELMNQNTCQNKNYLVTQAKAIQVVQDLGPELSFTVHNRGGTVLSEIYLALADADDWGDDQLGSEVLRPGNAFEVRVPAGNCVMKLRFVFDDDSILEQHDLNLCEQGAVTVAGPFLRMQERAASGTAPEVAAEDPRPSPGRQEVDKFGCSIPAGQDCR